MRDFYFELVEYLENFGEVSSDHKRTFDVTVKEGNLPHEIHERDVKYVKECDVVIADVTITSMGVGYEIGRAVALGKKVFCIYNCEFSKVSPMISGCNYITCRKYSNLEEAKIILKQYLNSLT